MTPLPKPGGVALLDTSERMLITRAKPSNFRLDTPVWVQAVPNTRGVYRLSTLITKAGVTEQREFQAISSSLFSDPAITAAGPVFKEGRALMGTLKDLALDAALTKAENGKYRDAADFLTLGFPRLGVSAEKLLGNVWGNKTNITTLVAAVLRAEEPSQGWNDKQMKSRALARAMLQLPAFADAAPADQTIET